MLTLAFDTSTIWESIALVEDSQLIGETNVQVKTSHSESLMSAIDNLLVTTARSIRDVDLIAVTTGPGSFTGLRIGVATAKGLALAIGCALAEVSTLEAIVLEAKSRAPVSSSMIPLLDAKRNQLFGACYYEDDNGLHLVWGPKAADLETFCSISEPSPFFCGPGAHRFHRELAAREIRGSLIDISGRPFPQALVIAQRGEELFRSGEVRDPATVTPLYVRAPDVCWNSLAPIASHDLFEGVPPSSWREDD